MPISNFQFEYGVWWARKADQENIDIEKAEHDLIEEQLDLIEACMNDPSFLVKIHERNEREMAMIRKKRWKWMDGIDLIPDDYPNDYPIVTGKL